MTDSPSRQDSALARESMDAELSSCPQGADGAQLAWMIVAIIMTTLAITTTSIAVVMGLLMYVKRKKGHSKGANSDSRLGEFISAHTQAHKLTFLVLFFILTRSTLYAI